MPPPSGKNHPRYLASSTLSSSRLSQHGTPPRGWHPWRSPATSPNNLVLVVSPSSCFKCSPSQTCQLFLATASLERTHPWGGLCSTILGSNKKVSSQEARLNLVESPANPRSTHSCMHLARKLDCFHDQRSDFVADSRQPLVVTVNLNL